METRYEVRQTNVRLEWQSNDGTDQLACWFQEGSPPDVSRQPDFTVDVPSILRVMKPDYQKAGLTSLVNHLQQVLSRYEARYTAGPIGTDRMKEALHSDEALKALGDRMHQVVNESSADTESKQSGLSP